MGTLFVGVTKNGEPLLAPISDAAMDRLRVIARISGNPYIVCGSLPGQYLRDPKTTAGYAYFQTKQSQSPLQEAPKGLPD